MGTPMAKLIGDTKGVTGPDGAAWRSALDKDVPVTPAEPGRTAWTGETSGPC
jgi:hypothetical protein